MSRMFITKTKESEDKKVKLEKSEVWIEKGERWKKQEGCYKCGDKGHWARNCVRKVRCYRCGEEGHIVPNCNQKVEGCKICKKVGHDMEKCWFKNKERDKGSDKEKFFLGIERNTGSEEDIREYIEGILDTGCSKSVIGRR